MKEIGSRPAKEHPHPIHWALVRQAALERDGCCRLCGQDHALEAHHRTYVRWGQEKVDDITMLCRDCHDLITGAQMKLRDDRRAMPTERIKIEIERFSTRSEDMPFLAKTSAVVDRVDQRSIGEMPPPQRTSVIVERIIIDGSSEMPAPKRNRGPR